MSEKENAPKQENMHDAQILESSANTQDSKDSKSDETHKEMNVSYQKSAEKSSQEKPTLGIVVSGANDLSVGISIVVAVLLGVGIGILLERVSGQKWLFWLGVVWGIAAAFLNLYRAYKRTQKEAQELASHPRYSYKGEDDEDSNGKYY